MKFIVGNWKSNPQTEEEAVNLISDIEKRLDGTSFAEVVVCPPFPYLVSVKSVLRNSKLGAQTVSAHPGGAFTGEVSAKQLADLKVKYVIIGHSERRGRESDADIKAMLAQAEAAGITPVYCVGYGLKPDDSEAKIKSVVRKQLGLIEGLNLKKIFVAYEPTWAISTSGTHKMPTFAHVEEIAEFIRSNVEHIESLAVLYGGSVDGVNAGEFKGLDGFLVGGASLDPDEFFGVIKA